MKNLKAFKKSLEARSEPSQAEDGKSFENSQPVQAVNYFLKKFHLSRFNSNLIAPFSDNLISLLTILKQNAMLDWLLLLR